MSAGESFWAKNLKGDFAEEFQKKKIMIVYCWMMKTYFFSKIKVKMYYRNVMLYDTYASV